MTLTKKKSLDNDASITLEATLAQYPAMINLGVNKFILSGGPNEITHRASLAFDFISNIIVANSLEKVSRLYYERIGEYPTIKRVTPYIVSNLCEMFYSGKKELAIRISEVIFSESAAKLFETDNTPQHAERFVDCIIRFFKEVL